MLDIEATNLGAEFGRVLAVCIKPYQGKVISFSDQNPKRLYDDGPLIRKALKELSQYDVWVTYYGTKFDLPFLATRLWGKRRPPLMRPFHFDCYPLCKRYMRLWSRRLARVQEFLNLDNKKTPLVPAVWQRATTGDKRALRQIVKHCEADVEVLEEVYDMVKDHCLQMRRQIV